MRVGLIALGSHQGAITARSIAQSWPVTVDTHDRATVEALAGIDMTRVESLAELAAACDVVVFREVHDDHDVERLIRDLGEALPPRGVVINTRPWGQPGTLRRWADVGCAAGVAVLDAMSSGPTGQSSGPSWASLMAGGDRDAFDRCRAVLESVATTVSYVGGPGTGELAKLVNTLVFNANVMVVAEMLALGDRLGFERAGLVDVIRASSGASWALDNLAGGAMHRWGDVHSNVAMFRARLDAIGAEIRERGLQPSPLEDWARSGIDALPAALDHFSDFIHT